MIRRMLVFLVALAAVPALAEVTYSDVAPIVRAKCAVCHRGPFLDLQTFPFQWDQSSDPTVLGREMLRRIQTAGRDKMPPVNGKPLTEEETALLVDWLSGGMLP